VELICGIFISLLVVLVKDFAKIFTLSSLIRPYLLMQVFEMRPSVYISTVKGLRCLELAKTYINPLF